jgi:AcrR family transcriptional regulator
MVDLPDNDSVRAILDAAEGLFARRGFASTTIKAIGADAGVNPALLYYYFPDKERLYHAILHRRLGGFAEQMASQLSPDLAPLEALSRVLRGYARMMQGAPHLPRLLARELADHEAAHALPVIREIAAGFFQRICDLIRAGQRAGTIRADLDPRFSAISLVSQVAWFFMAQPAVSRLLGHEGVVPPKEVDRYAEHAVRFTMAGLTPAAIPAVSRRSKPRVRR